MAESDGYIPSDFSSDEEGRVPAYFPDDFKQYVDTQLNRCPVVDGRDILCGWVFWSREDDQSEHPPNILDLKQKIKDVLRQFDDDVKGVCGYRMISMGYKFYMDRESSDQQLGVPGRVFNHGFPEFSPNVEYYSIKEYPLRDHALRCQLKLSWAVPLFDPSTHLCVGVLEIVSTAPSALICWICIIVWRVYWRCRALVKGDIFHATLKFDEVDCCTLLGMVNDKLHLRKGQGVVGRAFYSPNVLLCKDVTQLSIIDYPLAHYARYDKLGCCFAICLQSSCTGNDIYVLECFMPPSNKDYYGNQQTALRKILETMKKNFHTFKLASGEELGGHLYIEEIDSVQMSQTTKSLPRLEPLQSGGEMTQLDLLNQQSMNALSNESNVARAEQSNIDVTCSREKGKTKRPKRVHNKTGVKIEIPLDDILQNSKKSIQVAADNLKVSRSTLKRVCREYGFSRWPPRKKNMAGQSQPSESSRGVDHQQISQLSFDLPFIQASATVVHANPHNIAIEDANIVTIRAKYINDITIKFRLSLSSGLVELQQQIAKRLHLEAGSYYVKYKDEEDQTILIACDDDLQDCISTYRLLGTSIVNGEKLDFVQTSQTTKSLPRLEPLQSGGEMTQLDSSNQQSMDALNNGSNSQKKGKTKRPTRVKIEIPLDDILQNSRESIQAAADSLQVSRSTLKRACRGYGFPRWPPRKKNMVGSFQPSESSPGVDHQQIPQLCSDQPFSQASATVFHANPRNTVIRDANVVTVKAKYINDIIIKFPLSLSSGLVELQQQIAKRLHMEDGTYCAKYKDEVDDLIDRNGRHDTKAA
ncbi:hypothetical protein HYC85_026537 [Camellia sinensis]|uniref:RWP-RK domain-containing protein n=1 Tax=Camellia sinensis TaxID=4442 RepID=A0A7J7G7J5_CAMSI|nr:hypothetical protein HYC85_026537 [Camellia sinensis]